MNGVIEALHIYDEHNSLVLSHTYTSRPLSATHLLPLYLEHPAPRPNLIYLPNTNPPTLIFSLNHGNLLFLVTASSEVEPLLVLEFLHRVVDSFEEFLGAPLIAQKIEASYDVAAQLLTEMCDAGAINTTEPNALRDLVEVEGFMGKLLGGLNLPNLPTKSGFGANSNSGSPSLLAQTTPALPWRRANVRHTSNELYADVVETLSVTLAPSGRPLAAFANGTIAFTSKVSGVPDILVTLTGPSGKHNLDTLIELPVFHPCVRLARWREQPGVLSFIPPDGRFTLAGYEVDLLPLGADGKFGRNAASNLKLPVSLEIKPGLGASGSDFEVRLHVNRVLGATSGALSGRAGGGSGGGGGGAGRGFGGPHTGSPASPALQDLTVTVPLPADVRNLSEIRPSKGDANYSPGDRQLEWTIPNKELASGASYFGLRCTVVGQLTEEDVESDPTGFGFNTTGKDYSYDEGYQTSPVATKPVKPTAALADEKGERRAAQNKILMPSSASISFTVKGWLASGIKVESIAIDSRKSRGLGETVKPYKGVKYLTISKSGVEIRC
ncbi:Adaptor complexes medium subunit family-domain-containing protein [Lasiosphaeria hispida]|uniref:Adaptor complexes medium subunit family-domain-containing protein n=1 Tax=Lasiosphaeria hispida TaxID=260671 RepID=A0AAJ0HG44_9PEZI|nr:Adaptor complexes medium subunit family-domain-containing protein [Lasiosphaeria hispida]